jgi:hypothetical protein
VPGDRAVPEEYAAVMDNYDALCEEYPEVINQK